jgi:hypothetical protein
MSSIFFGAAGEGVDAVTSDMVGSIPVKAGDAGYRLDAVRRVRVFR